MPSSGHTIYYKWTIESIVSPDDDDDDKSAEIYIECFFFLYIYLT
jgi:hypothetical protein